MARDKSTEVDLVNPDSIDAEIMKRVGIDSTTEIARSLGMAPHEVKRRVAEILDSVDVLGLHHQRAKLMIQLREITQKAMDRIASIGDQVDDREYAAVLNASVSAIKVSLSELARMEKADTSKVEALNSMRVRELIELIDATVVTALKEISEKYGADEDEMLSIFREKMMVEASKRGQEL